MDSEEAKLAAVFTQTQKCRPYRKDSISGNSAFLSQRWERNVSSGLSYKGTDLSRSSGGWEDDIVFWNVDEPTPPSVTTHTNWVTSYIRCPSILPSSSSVILKPATKASGLISSSPHPGLQRPGSHPREMISHWPDRHPSSHSSLTLPMGLWWAQTKPLDRSQTHMHALNSLLPPMCQCLCVMSCDFLGQRFLCKAERPC